MELCMIYHYTSIQALNDILNGYRASNDKEQLSLWASSAYAMNDSTEMQYGWEVLRNNFMSYEVEHCVPKDKRLSSFMDKMVNSDIAGIMYQHFYREELTPFFLSFTENRDDLTMWSMYGGGGTGVCLCFDEDYLKIKEDSLITFSLLNVLYVNQKDNDELASIVLGQVVPTQYNKYLNENSRNDMPKINAIGSSLPLVSAYIKDSSFKHEKEKRIPIMAKDIRQSVHFRTSLKGNVISYVIVPVPKISLKEIIIGPCAQTTHIEKGLKLNLSICDFDIPISLSNVPYRNY